MTDGSCDAVTSTGSNREDKGCALSDLEVEGKREKSNGNNGDEKEIFPSRIGIGSCNSQNLTQPLWNVLSQRNLSAFVWAGDAIYAGKSGQRKYRKLNYCRLLIDWIHLK